MASVIVNERPKMPSVIVYEHNPQYRSSYPAKHTKLNNLKNQEAVFVTAKVVSITEITAQEGAKNPNPIVELSDGTGSAYVILRKAGPLDSPHDRILKEQTNLFFESSQGKVVHILNARVKQSKRKNEAQITSIHLDQWSQLRVVHDESIINAIENPQEQQEVEQPVVPKPEKTKKQAAEKPAKKEKKTVKKEKAPKENVEKQLEYNNLLEITPNIKSVNVKAKVVEVETFKKLKGFQADHSTTEDNQAKEPDSLKVTFADNSGKIFGVFPILPKFEMFKKGAIVTLKKARVDHFDADVKGETQIYITIFIKDDKNSKYKGEILEHNPEEESELNSIPVQESHERSDRKDPKNVSEKIWIVQTPQ